MLTSVDLHDKSQEKLPNDFRFYLLENEIIRLVLDAQSHVQSDSEQMITPQNHLTLLCYAYITGRFSTENLVNDLLIDKSFRYICVNNWPTAMAIRLFRRHFRELLCKCIALATYLCIEKINGNNLDFARYPSGVPNLHNIRASNLEFNMADAENRITLAAHLDCMALDE